MIRPRSVVATLVAAVVLSACVSTQATRPGNGVIRPPVPPDQVTIYRSAEQVPGKHEEVAPLSSKGDYNATDEQTMYRSMREKGGLRGWSDAG